MDTLGVSILGEPVLRVLPQDRACLTARQLDLVSSQVDYLLVSDQATVICDAKDTVQAKVDSTYKEAYSESKKALEDCNRVNEALKDEMCGKWCKAGYAGGGFVVGGLLFFVTGMVFGLTL